MNLSAILNHKYPDLEGWQVVNRGKGDVIEVWPKGTPKPTEKQLADWWPEVQEIRERERIAAEREQRYKQETDALLYDALAKLDAPELTEWKQAREAIKTELAYPEEESVDVIKR